MLRVSMNVTIAAVAIAMTSMLHVPPASAQTLGGAHAHTPIRDLPTQRFVDDLRTKNRDILRLYTADAVFVDPSGRLRGTAALRSLYTRIFATYDSDLTLMRNHISNTTAGATELSTESGTYTENLRVRSSGKMQRFRGTYRFTYQHQPDGRWFISRQEWTADRAIGRSLR